MSEDQPRQQIKFHLLIAAMIAAFPLQVVVEGDSWILRAFWAALPIGAVFVAARSGWRLLVGLGLGLFAAAFGVASGGAASAFVLAAAFAFTTIVILRQVFAHRVVTGETISGALCAYMLLGIVFSQIFRGLVQLDAGALQAGGGPASSDDMVYFSFVTLTTLGYGDISPVSDSARSFAVVEALIGQLYLVAVVARLVGLSVSSPSRER